MRFVCLSDIHGTYHSPIGRNDNVGDAFESKIDFIFSWARKHKATILQAGDLNDKSRNWEVLSFMLGKLREYQVLMFCVFGQHDLYMRRDPDDTPTALSILVQSGYIMRLGKKPVTFPNCLVYGANWGDKVPRPKDDKRKKVLVLHAPISKKKEYPGHDYTSPEHFMEKYNQFDLVLVGDIHKHIYYKENNRHLINTGPLLRLEATKYNMKHRPCFYVWDSKTNKTERIIIPHQPAKEILTRDHIVQKNISTTELEQFAQTIKKITAVENNRAESVKKFATKHIKSHSIKRLIKEIIDGKFPIEYPSRNGRKNTGVQNNL